MVHHTVLFYSYMYVCTCVYNYAYAYIYAYADFYAFIYETCMKKKYNLKSYGQAFLCICVVVVTY